MNILRVARAFVADYPMSGSLRQSEREGDHRLAPQFLAANLHPSIEVVESKLGDAQDAPPGASLGKGSPQLPGEPHWQWPEDHYFLAQFNLARCKLGDVQQQLPAHGMLYLFFNPRAMSAAAYYFEGNSELLISTAAPPARGKPDGYARFFARRALISFDAGFRFGAWQDSAEIHAALPEDLLAAVSQILGIEAFDDRRYFNDPTKSVAGHMLGAPTLLSEDDADGQRIRRLMDRYVLLYNFSMADSYIHLWIEATRLAACDFSRIEVTSSIG